MRSEGFPFIVGVWGWTCVRLVLVVSSSCRCRVVVVSSVVFVFCVTGAILWKPGNASAEASQKSYFLSSVKMCLKKKNSHEIVDFHVEISHEMPRSTLLSASASQRALPWKGSALVSMDLWALPTDQLNDLTACEHPPAPLHKSSQGQVQIHPHLPLVPTRRVHAKAQFFLYPPAAAASQHHLIIHLNLEIYFVKQMI